uniref:Uncharacterized protein n=1 Tax=Zea mays TaxID=4577 RepID=A0A804ND94_MAIZE
MNDGKVVCVVGFAFLFAVDIISYAPDRKCTDFVGVTKRQDNIFCGCILDFTMLMRWRLAFCDMVWLFYSWKIYREVVTEQQPREAKMLLSY